MLEPPPSPADRLLPLLDRLQRIDARESSHRGARLSPSQRTLLAAVAAEPGCGLQTVAATLGVTPPTASVSVARAEAAGWLRREADPDDRRAIRLALTAHGSALLRATEAARRAWASRLLAPLSPEERRILVDLLARALTPECAATPPPAPRGLFAALRRAREAWWRGSTR